MSRSFLTFSKIFTVLFQASALIRGNFDILPFVSQSVNPFFDLFYFVLLLREFLLCRNASATHISSGVVILMFS